MEAESTGELRLVLQMRDDEAIVAYRHQPETFRWTDKSGKKRRYTPDFLVSYVTGLRAYREVKTRRDLQRDPTLGGRLRDIERECRVRGARFELWTGRDPALPVSEGAAAMTMMVAYE